MAWTLVTGGGKRLGAEICRTLAARGHDIVVHYNNSHVEAEAIAEICKKSGVKTATIQGNFSTRESTIQFIESYQMKFPETQNLVNNVGNFVIKPGLQTTPAQWYDLFQTNLNAPFIFSQALASSIKRFKGCIVNIGVTGLDSGRGETYSTAYSCAKTALLMLTKSLAKELAPSQARVNMVSPGYLENAVDLPLDLRILPMGRPATMQEVAKVVAFFLSEDSKYITGQNIEIAGGVRL